MQEDLPNNGENQNQDSRNLMDEINADSHYEPRPLWLRILAWVLAGIVLLGFLGWCYWIAKA